RHARDGSRIERLRPGLHEPVSLDRPRDNAAIGAGAQDLGGAKGACRDRGDRVVGGVLKWFILGPGWSWRPHLDEREHRSAVTGGTIDDLPVVDAHQRDVSVVQPDEKVTHVPGEGERPNVLPERLDTADDRAPAVPPQRDDALK